MTTLAEKILQEILVFKREFTDYEQGYIDALLAIDDMGNWSQEHVNFITSVYKRLFKKTV